jgi:rubrerythrin
MITKAGSQTDFSEALQTLVELDYDAVEAYDAAIERLKNLEHKAVLQGFRKDHQRHIQEISDLLVAHGEKAPEKSDAKKWLTKGKVVIAGLVSDNLVLAAMQSNEIDTNTAYEKINAHESKWVDAENILETAWKDEKRHKAWLDSIVT